MNHTKNIVITGACRGIGKSLAHILANSGYSLTLGVLDVERGRAVADTIKQSCQHDNVTISVDHIDLTNFNSIRMFASHIDACSVLINNAGVMNGSLHKSNGIESTMITNHFGPFLLTRLLLPTLLQTSMDSKEVSRIVNVASANEQKAMAFPGADPTGNSAIRGELPDSVSFQKGATDKHTFYGLLSGTSWMTEGPQPYFMHTAYANSSLCILLSTFELSRRLSRLPPSRGKVTVNAVCPGYVNTELWKDSRVWNYLRWVLLKSPDQAGAMIAEFATSMQYTDTTGQFFSSIADTKPSRMADSEELAKLVWKHSSEIVEVPENLV
mmetsp:Transcript_22908/g.33471  ORF Transcript_22908/g.33471 Transcript_22908/m.33471 type:complete len:326 (+) Transcript_22908:27-1004(+)